MQCKSRVIKVWSSTMYIDMFTKCLTASSFLFILEESTIDKHAIVKWLAFQPGSPAASGPNT